MDPTHVGVLEARGADAFDGAVAEGDVGHSGAPIGRKEPRAIVTAPRAPGEEHRERDERRALHQRAASSRVRPYQGASGKVMGRIAGSVTPAFR